MIIKVFNIIIINRNKVFRFINYKKALKYIKTINKKLGVNTLKKKILKAFEFIFYKNKILVSRNYIRELFPAFANKPKSQGVIVIISKNIIIANFIIYLNNINKNLNFLINANNISLANNPKVKFSSLVLN